MRRLLFVLLVLFLPGCPVARGVVNDSPAIRWWLFSSFGASKICPEMLKRGLPLKISQLGAASVGRFFPAQCNVQVDNQRQVMTVTVTGTGYATLPVARRVGFSVGITVEYAPDFRLESDAIYVWGKFNRFTTDPQFQIVGVENPIVNLATQTPAGNVATALANGILASEIGKGFTVVRLDDGDDFAIGHLDPPTKPARQFKSGEGHVVLGSDLTQISAQSREFLGPFEVADKSAALYFHAKVDGAPLVYTVVDRSVGEPWRRQYESVQSNGPPPGTVQSQGTLAVGEANLRLPVPPGSFYIVLENQSPPPLSVVGVALPGVEQVAHVSYSTEVGDR